MPPIDREAPLRFLRTAFQPDDWIAILLKSYETGQVTQRVGPVDWVMHPRFQAWLRFKNSRKYNVYCSVNAIAPWKRTRTRDSVGAIRHVFLEADYDGRAVLSRIAARPDLPEPSYVLYSSPNRVHVLWRVIGFQSDYVEALQRQLARELDTDPAATPATQMTRLVGYNNHKYRPPNVVTIDNGATDRLYTPADFPSVATAPHTAASPTVQPSASPNTLDRVERARRYLSHVPPAIAGQHGDARTFRVCCRLVRGFALDDDVALLLLREWNSRCQPPWDERALRDKLLNARRYGRERVGALLSTATVQHAPD